MKLNPRLAHGLLEAVQALGVVSVISSLPGLSLIAPWIGIVGGVATGLSTIIKTQIIGDIPATATAPSPTAVPPAP